MDTMFLPKLISFMYTTLLIAFQCESDNVLFIPMYSGGSHFLALIPIGSTLVQRGHHVTFLLSDALADQATKPEYDHFHFDRFSCPGLQRETAEFFEDAESIAFAETRGSQMFIMISRFAVLHRRACEAILSDEDLMKRLENIDVIIVDVAWPCGVYVKSFLFKHKHQTVRSVIVSPSASNPYVQQLAGSPVFPSYQPALMSGLTSSMTFLERIVNILSHLGSNLFLTMTITRPFFQLVDTYNLDPNMKSSIHDYVDLYLINSDFVAEFPFPLMPNIVPVGGLTARAASHLEDELENIMQSAGEHGVIVFSLGTVFTAITKSNPELAQNFIGAMGRVPQKVLFHAKEAQFIKLPNNMKVLTWLPLQDLLGHPQTRLFVYHGGNNGFLEAVYHGVPMVIVPLIGDQIDVAVRVVAMGLGTSIDKTRLNEDYIHEQLVKTLNNPSFSANAKRLSAIFRDRPMRPAERAAFWIEHVIKYGGEYMRSPAHDLSYIQYYMVDVIVFFIVHFATISYLAYRIVKSCICCILGARYVSKRKRD